MTMPLAITLLAALACVVPAQAAERATVLRPTDLKVKPFLDADNVVRLPERAAVEVTARQGPWMQVRYQGRQGYVRMLQVRLDVGDAAIARAPAPMPSVNRTASSSSPTVTTGVRGFDEQALKDAQPNPEQYRLMVGYAVSAQQAAQFAERSALTARKVPYYDEDGDAIKGGQ